ncbi:MAG: sialidase family protein [Verrucomicrobiota bacterium]
MKNAHLLHLFGLLSAATIFANANPSNLTAAEPQLVSATRIWDQAAHNAFTGLIRYDDHWLCVFREGSAHVSPDGSLRILTSSDGETWQALSLVTHPTEDLRDAKISLTPDGNLLLNGAGMIADADIRYHSMSWLSKDGGKTWDQGRRIGDPGYWLWRVSWNKDAAYTMGYSTERDRNTRKVRFYKSSDGLKFETLISKVNLPAGAGEDTIMFQKDGTALCIFRYEAGDKMARLGSSRPPYTEWTWKKLNRRIGGPNMITLPDGRIVVAARMFRGSTKNAKTVLAWLDPDKGELNEFITLPSGGDTSYPGLVWHDDMLWISYYSSHEKKTAIYLAKVKF